MEVLLVFDITFWWFRKWWFQAVHVITSVAVITKKQLILNYIQQIAQIKRYSKHHRLDSDNINNIVLKNKQKQMNKNKKQVKL